jgi:hypothetical protein
VVLRFDPWSLVVKNTWVIGPGSPSVSLAPEASVFQFVAAVGLMVDQLPSRFPCQKATAGVTSVFVATSWPVKVAVESFGLVTVNGMVALIGIVKVCVLPTMASVADAVA